jgi:DNA-binding response OmpR family regulator
VLFLSALGSRDDMVKGYGTGGDLYLAKPFDPARLRRNIDLFFEKMGEPPHHRFSAVELHQLESAGPEKIAQAATSKTSSHDSDTRPRMTVTVPAEPPTRNTAHTSDAAEVFLQDAYSKSGATSHANAAHLRARILAVDDECAIAEMMVQALHHEFEVFTACDGLDAIDKIASYQPDIMIIDTMMPRLSGYQLCESLRKNARFAHTPLILVSAKHSQRDREYSMKIGGDYFLQKPFTGAELMHAAQQMTHHPRYRLHPKALTETQIRDLEAAHKKRLDKEHAQQQHQEHEFHLHRRPRSEEIPNEENSLKEDPFLHDHPG